MTAKKGGFDPFAYGQVELRKDRPAAGGGVEDVLFAGGDAPRADKGWEPSMPEAGGGLPADRGMSADAFGSEILGTEAAPAKRPSVVKKPAAAAWQGGTAADAVIPAAAAPKRPQYANASLAGEPAKEKFADVAAPRAALPRRHASVFSLIVPLLVLAGGTSGCAWLYLVERDPITAGIGAVLTCVATVFTWVWLRA